MKVILPRRHGGPCEPRPGPGRLYAEAGPQVQVLFVGTPDGMERDLVEKAGYAFRGIPMGGFQRSLGPTGAWPTTCAPCPC